MRHNKSCSHSKHCIGFYLHNFSECLCQKDRPLSTALFHKVGNFTCQLQGRYPEVGFIVISAEVLATWVFFPEFRPSGILNSLGLRLILNRIHIHAPMLKCFIESVQWKGALHENESQYHNDEVP